MKKFYLVGLITLFFVGCSTSKESLKSIKCELVSDQSASGYVSTTTYDIYYEDEIVKMIEQKETIDSSDKNILTFFKDQLESQYKNANDLYGGYSYEIKEEENKIIIITNIDYEKMDISKFLSDNSGMKAYINDNNELTLEGIKKMYTNIGASCE